MKLGDMPKIKPGAIYRSTERVMALGYIENGKKVLVSEPKDPTEIWAIETATFWDLYGLERKEGA